MKQPITLFLLLFIHLAQAQIIIDGDDMPQVNDTVRVSDSFLDSMARADYTLTGENILWDFQQLVPISQTVRDYERAINTPYGVFFLGFNRYGVKQFDSLGVAQFQFRNVYQYFRSNSRDFRVEGLGLNFQGVPLPAYFSDEDELYQFPLAYGDRDSSTFSFSLALPAIGGYESAGYRINTVDGFGTISTPFGSFECIRLVSEVVANDSINAAGVSFGLPTVRRSYQWLAKGEKVPVLEISGNVVGGTFFPTRVRYPDRFRTIGEVVETLQPQADFTSNLLNLTVLDTIQLTSTSTESSLHEWALSPATYEFVEGTTRNSRDPKIAFQAAGIYNVSLSVTNTFGRADTTKIGYLQVDPVISTTSTLAQPEVAVQVFPNPTNNYINIQLLDQEISEVQLRLFDAKGQLLLTKKYTAKAKEVHQLAVSQLPSGLYWLEVKTAVGKTRKAILVE